MSVFGPPYLSTYVASLFPHAAHERIKSYWPIISRWLVKYGVDKNEDLVIYTLATISAETYPVFSPDGEQPSKVSKLTHDGKIRDFGAYDVLGTKAQKSLGNRAAPEAREQMLRAQHGDKPRPDFNDGFNFRGRGFVQLTGRWNYEHFQKRLGPKIQGLDLVNKPDQAADPEIAAQIIVIWVASWKKAAILDAMQAKDYLKARQAVNHAGLNMKGFKSVIDLHARNSPVFQRLLEHPKQQIA